jgi:hypothetical protein
LPVYTSASTIPGPCVLEMITRVTAAAGSQERLSVTLECDRSTAGTGNSEVHLRRFVLAGMPVTCPDPPSAVSEIEANRV